MRLLFREDVAQPASGKIVPHPSALPLRCASCNAEYRRGDVFCRECGAQVAQPSGPPKAVCPSCGTAVPLPARFCNGCGGPLAADGGRVEGPSDPLRRPTHPLPVSRPQLAAGRERVDGDGARGARRPPPLGGRVGRSCPRAVEPPGAGGPAPRSRGPAGAPAAGGRGQPPRRRADRRRVRALRLSLPSWRPSPGTGGPARRRARRPRSRTCRCSPRSRCRPLALLLGALYHVYFWTREGRDARQGAARPARGDRGRRLAARGRLRRRCARSATCSASPPSASASRRSPSAARGCTTASPAPAWSRGK